MPGTDGLAATREIAADERLAAVRVVILTTFELDEYVFEALRAGATGFLVKHTEPAELIRAVRTVAEGEALLSPGVTRRLIAEFAGRAKEPPASSRLDALTAREREIVAVVAEGLSNERDRRTAVPEPGHRQDPREPRDDQARRARDRAQLVVLAYEAGLVRPAGRDAGPEAPSSVPPSR